ncbi:MAG: transpeptidase family protein, partial [Phaeodactylibacter sp.]|nr:transpeptidase family protein [Phaeodactylibacter sp.]
EPKSGDDVVCTIDVDMQDITEGALHRAMSLHDAQYGVAIVMEVETGAVRAIANLGKTKDGDIWETYNHAVGSATEPGSTFKLASIMALLESGAVKLTDSIDLEQGKTTFYEEELEDASYHQLDKTTVQTAFEISSNVGMAKLVQQHFGDNNKADKFIEYLKKFNLHQRTGIEIEGEASPIIKEAYSEEDNWSGTTLPWMSIGYELTLAPIQLLTFYNAIANNGREMKPYLVSKVQRYGETIQNFPPTVINRKIASDRTIRQVRQLLEGVVLRGTASKYNDAPYHFAGKTGTSQLNYRRYDSGSNRVGGYQASFVGYFPAEKPKYSCIVVISSPRKGGFYGGDVALPVFREIADKVYATKTELLEPMNDTPRPILAANHLPDAQIGNRKEMEFLLNTFQLNFVNRDDSPIAVVETTTSDTLELNRRTIVRDRVPNVVGMGLRDALYILENMGLKVEVSGFGKVVRQSIIPGTFAKGQTLRLYLG